MTKKHFIALADIFRPILQDIRAGVYTGEEAANHVQIALSNFCYQQNPKYKEGRWLAYLNGECGPNGEKKK